MKAFKILATTLLILLCSWSSLEAQQLFRRTQYVFNPYLANPAVAGTKTFSPVMASYRQQWAGFSGAPTSYTVSAHTNLPNSLGAGIIIFNELDSLYDCKGFLARRPNLPYRYTGTPPDYNCMTIFA